MKRVQILGNLCLALLLITAATLSQAQKLPTTQENSLWAPAGVKMDARLKDWGTLQAFNKTVGLNYTIANDEKNLYLVIKTDDPSIANKIVAGGIDLTINTSGKKSAKEAYVVSFPLVNPANLRSQMSAFRRPQGGGAGGQFTPPDSAAIAQMRKQAVAAFKEIKLSGFKDIADSVVSIYNEYGIKAAADYDDKGSLICELAIPLKYMNLVNNQVKLAYNIRLNGLNIEAMMSSMMAAAGAGGGRVAIDVVGGAMPAGGNVMVTGGRIGGGGGGTINFSTNGGNNVIAIRGGGMGDMQNMTAPTDFWATYTPAKKP